LKTMKLLLAQLVITIAASYLGAKALYLGAAVYGVCQWGLMPLLGGVVSYKITVRGVNNYLAWFIPPLSGIAAHYLAFFYMPLSPGPFLVCALASIVGAAAGDVVKKTRKSK
jgi:hypothetical protein